MGEHLNARPEHYPVGTAVTWLCEPRGGYGFVIPVDGIVTKHGTQRVRIRVSLRSGEQVERWVHPSRLHTRKEE